MNDWRLLAAGLSIVFVSSCALAPRALVIEPQIQVAEQDIARGHKVMVTVADARSQDPGGAAAEGHTETLRPVIEESLRKRGFTIVAQAGAEVSELRVELRNLTSRGDDGFWTETWKSECSAKGICLIGGVSLYEQLYRGTDDDKSPTIQGASARARSVNAAVSHALQRLLTDPSMLSCLVAP